MDEQFLYIGPVHDFHQRTVALPGYGEETICKHFNSFGRVREGLLRDQILRGVGTKIFGGLFEYFPKQAGGRNPFE